MVLLLDNQRLDRHAARPRDRPDPGVLRDVIRLLDPGDRRLAELVFVEGASLREASRRLTLNPGAASRRLRRLRNRLLSPTLRVVGRSLDSLDADHRRLAVDVFVLGLSVNAAAVRQHLSRRDAQSRLDFLLGWVRATHRADRALAARQTELLTEEDR